jgi:ribosome-interacting GTPase 1
MLSVFEIDQYERLRQELYNNNIRLDTEPPSIHIRQRSKNGIQVNASDSVSLDENTIMEVLRQNGYVNAEITVRGDPSIDELVDGMIENRVYIPSMVTVNKADLIEEDYLPTVHENLRDHDLDPDDCIFISAEEEKGLDALTERMWDELGLIRIYMDKPGRGVDYEEPLILREGDTVDDALDNLGGELGDRFRFARVSGPSAKHDEQQVGTDHELADEDVLRVITSR